MRTDSRALALLYCYTEKNQNDEKLSVGGQAVIEGVMMKGPEKMAVAVRQANGEIAVDVKPVSSIRDRYPFLKTVSARRRFSR